MKITSENFRFSVAPEAISYIKRVILLDPTLGEDCVVSVVAWGAGGRLDLVDGSIEKTIEYLKKQISAEPHRFDPRTIKYEWGVGLSPRVTKGARVEFIFRQGLWSG